MLILAHGAKGCRFALPHASLQLTQIRVGNPKLANYHALEQERQRMEDLIVNQLARDTARPAAKVRSDLNRGLCLDAYQAQAYGIIDGIVNV